LKSRKETLSTVWKLCVKCWPLPLHATMRGTGHVIVFRLRKKSLLLYLETEEWLLLHGGPRQFFPVPCLRESSRLHHADLDLLHVEAALLQLLADQNRPHSGAMRNAVLRCKICMSDIQTFTVPIRTHLYDHIVQVFSSCNVYYKPIK